MAYVSNFRRYKVPPATQRILDSVAHGMDGENPPPPPPPVRAQAARPRRVYGVSTTTTTNSLVLGFQPTGKQKATSAPRPVQRAPTLAALEQAAYSTSQTPKRATTASTRTSSTTVSPGRAYNVTQTMMSREGGRPLVVVRSGSSSKPPSRNVTPRRTESQHRRTSLEQRVSSARLYSTPQKVIASDSQALTEFEQLEIMDYDRVYYYGQSVVKTYLVGGINHGYDDSRGDYLGLTGDHILYRYELISILGAGSFGKVYKAFDHKEQKTVALKVLRNSQIINKQGLVEVKLLDRLRRADPQDEHCCIRMFSNFYFRKHLCITFELLSMNLYELLQKKNLRGLSLTLVRKFALQVLSAFSFAHKLRIIHADVKPENILLRAPDKSGIKVIDWGSGAMVSETIYSYIQSRYYRAPEVILGLPYGQEIDIWSIGCVLCELYTGIPIFPGPNEKDQLGLIAEVLGMPPTDMIVKSPVKSKFFQELTSDDRVDNDYPAYGSPEYLMRSNQVKAQAAYPEHKSKYRLRTQHRPWSKQLKNLVRAPPEFLSFVYLFLQWDPQRRCTPETALAHPWIQESLRQRTAQSSRSNSTGTLANQRPQPSVMRGMSVGRNTHNYLPDSLPLISPGQ
ncbi:Kinase, CMGC DYRK [Giardia muris]|uniref:dual-specificity kinase n=1 Tax=Giardia muris TaxID=5742 RepID=A0A4Z1T6G4_GIAMU|nr:Kinase, CMGC DYRK [Giardia muris]|eukprot:TNJ29653.1 Kinase, CMGC DYRK [Giardia muris]